MLFLSFDSSLLVLDVLSFDSSLLVLDVTSYLPFYLIILLLAINANISCYLIGLGACNSVNL